MTNAGLGVTRKEGWLGEDQRSVGWLVGSFLGSFVGSLVAWEVVPQLTFAEWQELHEQIACTTEWTD